MICLIKLTRIQLNTKITNAGYFFIGHIFLKKCITGMKVTAPDILYFTIMEHNNSAGTYQSKNQQMTFSDGRY